MKVKFSPLPVKLFSDPLVNVFYTNMVILLGVKSLEKEILLTLIILTSMAYSKSTSNWLNGILIMLSVLIIGLLHWLFTICVSIFWNVAYWVSAGRFYPKQLFVES